MTRACKVYAGDAISIFDATVTGEAVQHEGQPLVTFHVAGTFEEFIERRADKVARGRHVTRHRNFVRQLTFDQAVVIGEVDIYLNV